MSKYMLPGFTMTMSAPSSISRSYTPINQISKLKQVLFDKKYNSINSNTKLKTCQRHLLQQSIDQV